jgi:hypothetical protein
MGKQALDFLIFNEMIIQEFLDGKYNFRMTKLGVGIHKSNQSPEEGLLLYLDL